jgi:hypothetical protein
MTNEPIVPVPWVLTEEQFEERKKKLRTLKDVTDFAKESIAPMLQEMLEAEMSEHLDHAS